MEVESRDTLGESGASSRAEALLGRAEVTVDGGDAMCDVFLLVDREFMIQVRGESCVPLTRAFLLFLLS